MPPAENGGTDTRSGAEEGNDMAEETKPAEGTEPGKQDEGFTPITSQEQLDKVIKGRIERAERKAAAPYADYDELKAKAEAYDALGRQFAPGDGEGGPTIEQRLAALEAENQSLKHAGELAAWKAQVSKETGVPEAVLRGDTLEEIQGHAAAVRQAMPVYPTVTEQGGQPAAVTAEDIMKEQDVAKRHQMWALHPELLD